MSTRTLMLLLIPLVLVAGLLLHLQGSCKGFKCGFAEPPTSSSGIIYDADVERTVHEFGRVMQNVPLQADAGQVRASMDAAYGPYVVPELIDMWARDPANAPGRATSSPWPESITIGSMEGDARGFVVNGTVVEVANGDEGEEIVGSYPVKLRLKERGGSWRIYYFEKGAYSPIPARATVIGTYTCLPHRDTSGPQTLECAFGIRSDSGDHYAVSTALMSSTEWQQIPTGARVRVSGVLTPTEMLSSDQWQKYDIAGIISATTIQEI